LPSVSLEIASLGRLPSLNFVVQRV
jgi:hypothetical protein